MVTQIGTHPTSGTFSTAGAAIINAEERRSNGPGPYVMDAGTLRDDAVVNVSGEDLGQIEAIMLDVTSGRIAYAVLSFGGFLGMGKKLFCHPMARLDIGRGRKAFRYQCEQGTLGERARLRQGSLAFDGGSCLGERVACVLRCCALLG